MLWSLLPLFGKFLTPRQLPIVSWVLRWFFKQTWNSSLARCSTKCLSLHMKWHSNSFGSQDSQQTFYMFSFFASCGLRRQQAKKIWTHIVDFGASRHEGSIFALLSSLGHRALTRRLTPWPKCTTYVTDVCHETHAAFSHLPTLFVGLSAASET